MPLSDPDRIAARTPRLVALWQAMQPLAGCVSFMNTGAHPDDETSGMLAALGAAGLDLSYACSTRGEGGQNDIGTESGAALGALRTAEMERAAASLNLRLYWLGTAPDDPITDFGFSKSGVETLGKWGRDRTLARFVTILRTERPDIICPTFLNIPGQHGHHRAMTEAAHLVMDLAADPGFSGCDLPVWQVKKLYLPAWSGAGQAYDDDEPPPPATLTIDGRGIDPVTGWSHAQIAQRSRRFHATQAMGRWVPPGDENDWPLHLAYTRVPGPDRTILRGLPQDLSALAGFAGAPVLETPLAEAQSALTACRAAFPEGAAMLEQAVRALRGIRAARELCPQEAAGEVLHRLNRKESQLGRVIQVAAGVDVAGRLAQDWLRAGETVALSVESRIGLADRIDIEVTLPTGWNATDAGLTPGPDAPPHDAYRDTFLPDTPPAPALRITTRSHRIDSVSHIALEVPPVLLPARSANVTPDAAVLNRATARRGLTVTLGDIFPRDAAAALDLPQGWQARPAPDGFTVTAPDAVACGLYDLPLTLDGQPAMTMRRIAHPHIAPTALTAPARVQVRVVDVALPDVRVAHIGSGHDRVGHWLSGLGIAVQHPDPAQMTDTDLDSFDTVVIGIFALKFRAGLAALMPRLHAWVERGGTLVTLYHRPWDNWDPDTTPLRRIEIGQPSLRWRVTDENAAVTHLLPDHPLLTTPNRIGPDDWTGWHKERGLYFAKSWDPAYRPLLEMADPDEAPHQGALLAADIGAGRHIHCALILHHQMERLVPGAFALIANLIARRG